MASARASTADRRRPATSRPARARCSSIRKTLFSTTDAHELLARPEVHAVSICTPTDTHVELALAALESGQARAGREARRTALGRRRTPRRRRASRAHAVHAGALHALLARLGLAEGARCRRLARQGEERRLPAPRHASVVVELLRRLRPHRRRAHRPAHPRRGFRALALRRSRRTSRAPARSTTSRRSTATRTAPSTSSPKERGTTTPASSSACATS